MRGRAGLSSCDKKNSCTSMITPQHASGTMRLLIAMRCRCSALQAQIALCCLRGKSSYEIARPYQRSCVLDVNGERRLDKRGYLRDRFENGRQNAMQPFLGEQEIMQNEIVHPGRQKTFDGVFRRFHDRLAL